MPPSAQTGRRRVTRMGQGSGSSSIAPQIVDEEALALIGKSKGKEKRKKDGKKNLDI